MCEYCHSFPHLPGCPNAPEPEAVYECEECGKGIYPGEEYAEIGDAYYHYECLDKMGKGELVDLLDLATYELLEAAEIESKECEEDD